MPENQVIHERYEILNVLGKGAFSTVYRVYDKNASRHVAMKVLNPHENASGHNEIKHLRGIKDNRIITLYDSFTYASQMYIIMDELLCNLYTLGRNYPKGLPEKLLYRMMKHTLEGTAYLHSKGVIHADIKPENILLDKNANFKLCDFGSACTKTSRHQQNEIQTLNYRSVEIIMGNTTYTETIDIWSLACVYYELATGKPLFNPHPEHPASLEEVHVAQITELMGPLPKELIFSSESRLAERIFNLETGELKHAVKSKSQNIGGLGGIRGIRGRVGDMIHHMLNLSHRDRMAAQDLLRLL